MNTLYNVHVVVASWTSSHLVLVAIVFTLVMVGALVTFLSDEPTVEDKS